MSLEVLEKQNILFKHLKAKIYVTFGGKKAIDSVWLKHWRGSGQ